MYRQGRKNLYKRWFYLFLLGFLAGIFIMNLCSGCLIENHEIFSAVAIRRVQFLKVDGGRFLSYELPLRFRSYLLLLLFSTTLFGVIVSYLCILWYGFLAGMTMTAVIIRFGFKGIFLMLAGIFPQHLLFIPAAVLMLCWCCQTCCFLYFPEKSVWPVYQNKKRQWLHLMGMLLWIICVVMIGCILECYVNPMLLSDVAGALT